MKTTTRLVIFSLAMLPSAAALACASCGCSLSSDWGSQGLASGTGFRFDLRYDDLNQNEVRSGTGKVGSWPIPGHEQELYTKNQYLTAGFDYSVSPNWGVTVLTPFIDRSHASNGFAFDGSDAGTSHTQSLGDVKVIGRYTGLTSENNVGLQFGFKLPTGSFTQNFSGGAIAGQPLDRGLQPGSGTTDLILGAFKFASLSQDWDYFSQALVQLPLNSRSDYKPGMALNVNVGFRYMALGDFMPQVQLNGRISAKDSGAMASPDDSGGTTLYLSPGASYAVNDKLRVYGFLQVPVYQRLNGFQLAPKTILSVGMGFSF